MEHEVAVAARRHVARAQPSVAECLCGRIRSVEVPEHDVGSPDADLARHAISDLAAVIVLDRNVVEEHLLADRAIELRSEHVLGPKPRHDRARLGEAVLVIDSRGRQHLADRLLIREAERRAANV